MYNLSVAAVESLLVKGSGGCPRGVIAIHHRPLQLLSFGSIHACSKGFTRRTLLLPDQTPDENITERLAACVKG